MATNFFLIFVCIPALIDVLTTVPSVTSGTVPFLHGVKQGSFFCGDISLKSLFYVLVNRLVNLICFFLVLLIVILRT